MLTDGGATTFAVCLRCAQGGASLRRPWLELVGWLGAIILGLAAVGVALALLAGCSEPVRPPLCQVPGELGAGAFTAHDCRHETGCLDGWRFAAGSIETIIFCPAGDREVTEVVSSDPRVMVSVPPVAIAPGQVAFDLRAGDAGEATIELRGPDLLERLTLTVADIAALDATGPARIVVGGRAAITSTKAGAGGVPLFGRGGYAVTAPVGLSSRAATTSTRDCALAQPDVILTADAVGTYEVRADVPGAPWTGTVEVVPVDAVASVELTPTRITGNARDGYGAYVRVLGRDASGRALPGVTCAWQSPRPVFIAEDVCWSLVLLSTDEPLDLTCTIGGRALATVHLSTALVL